MNFAFTILLGAIEGFTEFLPISSTAHLILASRAFAIPETEFIKSFIIAIQLGAIAGVGGLYWRKLFCDKKTIMLVATAFVPTAIFGFFLYRIIKELLFENIWIIVASLFLGGIALIVFEYWEARRQKSIVQLSYTKAFVVGCVQALAVVPGISRAGATIIGGMVLGIERRAIVEFSFLLAVPTMAAATGYDLLQNSASFTFTEFNSLVLGFLASLITAIFAVRFLLRFIGEHSFVAFGIYRIVLAILVIFFIV